jgi:hypothetical protein
LVLSRFEQPHQRAVLTISTEPTFAQTIASILTTVNSHLNEWKTTTISLRHNPYSAS